MPLIINTHVDHKYHVQHNFIPNTFFKKHTEHINLISFDFISLFGSYEI